MCTGAVIDINPVARDGSRFPDRFFCGNITQGDVWAPVTCEPFRCRESGF